VLRYVPAGAISRYDARNNYIIFAQFGNCTAQGRRNPPMPFVTTAYSVSGITAKGTVTHEGIVAADPTVLPLGSVIRVSGAGAYSGVYAVTDTGSKVEGRKIDIYMPNTAEAKEFGKKHVTVSVLRTGDNQRNGQEVTPRTEILPAPPDVGNP
jgi:3D (Asp-Asp-Asp) domain-containing protein